MSILPLPGFDLTVVNSFASDRALTILSASPIPILLLRFALGIGLQYRVFLNVEGMTANGRIGEAEELVGPHLRDLHTIQIVLATSRQDPRYASVDRARPPSYFNHLQFTRNEEQVQAGGAQLSI